MKIHDLTTKKSLEVEATDLLLIEDAGDTKAITVGEFLECVDVHSDERTKRFINEALDKVIKALEDSKFKFDYDKYFTLNIWISSASGNIQITVLDTETNQWLTRDELIELLGPVDEAATEEEKYARSYVIKVLVDDSYRQAVAYEICNFNDDHPSGTNQWLEDSNAGYIKAHFDDLTQNEIAGITHNDVYVGVDTIVDDNGVSYHYHFTSDDGSFVNSVPYEAPVTPPLG